MFSIFYPKIGSVSQLVNGLRYVPGELIAGGFWAVILTRPAWARH